MFLAIDYGARYVGLAATDADGKITYRYATLDQQKVKVIEEILDIVKKEHVTTVVVGLPKGLQGQETQQTAVTQGFIAQLSRKIPGGVTVDVAPETLSSVEARRNLEAEGLDTSLEHAEAARLLLEEYLS